jgi:hypothetical protein
MAEVGRPLVSNMHDFDNAFPLQERQMDLVEVLSFLFMLSTMELGRVRSYNIEMD